MRVAGRFGFFLSRFLGVVFCFILWIGWAQAQTSEQAGCNSCHDQNEKLAKSAHADLSCDTCHEKHEEYPHPKGIAKPVCTNCHEDQALAVNRSVHGQAAKAGNAAPDCALCHGDAHELLRPRSTEFRTSVPDTCGMCHTKVVEEFRASVHGQALLRGVTDAPLCTDCHGEHNIIRHTEAASPVSRTNIRETCASCHADVRLNRKFGLPPDRILSFDSSFHGLAAKAGSQTVANCASCHGVHNILPSSDPKSTVNVRNLPRTCGACHPGAGQRFAIGSVHVQEGRNEPVAVRWTRQLYLLVIPLTIGLMLLHNGGDWIRKLIRSRLHRVPLQPVHSGRGEVRMLPFERVQHALLGLSFTVLVFTGFALKYPDQWWARPLLLWEANISMRGVVHRTAAVVMIAVAMMHLISLLVNRRLREHWLHMIPNARDAREALANFFYNIGLRSRKPFRSSHSYVEKAEYWAVVWGTAVMAITGIMLWANNLMLAWLPKSWLDVATTMHFYEAVLATLAIVVWHFYGVIFDPSVYPLDTAFLTGRTVRENEPSEEEAQASEADTIEPSIQ